LGRADARRARARSDSGRMLRHRRADRAAGERRTRTRAVCRPAGGRRRAPVILAAAAPGILSLADALDRIAARAGALDRSPRFPEQNFRDLQAAGVLCLERYGVSAPLGEQLAVVRAVACADGSTARILDGHLNGVERIFALGS